MKTVPANPMVKLSALIVIVNMPMFGPTKARIAKKRLVLAIRIVAIIMHLDNPSLRIATAPIAVPKRETQSP